MTTTALIADDEEEPRARLAAALGDAWPQLRILAESANGADAWDAWLEHEPQVCFLDVRMPGLTGIEVAQRIGGRAEVVFVAAPGDHALAAFDSAAVDCLVKPVRVEPLERVLGRVQRRLADPATGRGAPQPLLDGLAGQVRKPAPLEIIPTSATTGADPGSLRVADVVYFEADARATRVVYTGGELTLRTPLKELLVQLDPAVFWQVHRAVVVNHRHIAGSQRTTPDNMVLTLRGRDERLPVSRPFQGLFSDR